MKKLSLHKARKLVKRELGISATALTAPPEMNKNPDCPWYELHLGNQTIMVTCSGYGPYSKGNELINLLITYENSSFSVSEYFYTDSLEYCDEYTQKARYDILCEKMGITDNGPKFNRLDAEASDAIFRHYHSPIFSANSESVNSDSCAFNGAEKGPEIC